MTKRVRGTPRSRRRPGARPPTERSGPRVRRAPAVSPPSQPEAAQEIAEEVVDERPAAAAEELHRTARATQSRHRVKAGSLLAARAATEYVYVSQDMRRILVVSGVLLATLIVLWLLVVVLRVIELPFY
ncbi:MAG TPA: hypothetical protein VNB06_06750 [Thermoanaerobaculia bacterium]|nr:hypothetical protein [Thermoanaerobaculia bacterium]